MAGTCTFREIPRTLTLAVVMPCGSSIFLLAATRQGVCFGSRIILPGCDGIEAVHLRTETFPHFVGGGVQI